MYIQVLEFELVCVCSQFVSQNIHRMILSPVQDANVPLIRCSIWLLYVFAQVQVPSNKL